jgi:hypothetical protein
MMPEALNVDTIAGSCTLQTRIFRDIYCSFRPANVSSLPSSGVAHRSFRVGKHSDITLIVRYELNDGFNRNRVDLGHRTALFPNSP